MLQHTVADRASSRPRHRWASGRRRKRRIMRLRAADTASRVELLLGASQLHEERRRLEPVTEPVVPALDAIEQRLRADRVRVAERAAQEGREAEPEDGAHVAV